jgi:uncharacterized membrane protein
MEGDMSQNNDAEKESKQIVYADVGSAYGHAWRQMWKYILELLLIIILAILFSIPAAGLSVLEEADGAGAFFLGIFSLAYVVLVLWPIEYGVAYAALKAARGDKLEVKDMFEVFQNYGNAILANILTAIIVGFGMILLIIPGIFFACKLAFVPYLIVDRKMEAIEAVKQSWRMTDGHALTVFLIGFLAIFIAIAGLIVFFVGVIAAAIWIEVAFASLYYAVTKPVAEQKAATGA